MSAMLPLRYDITCTLQHIVGCTCRLHQSVRLQQQQHGTESLNAGLPLGRKFPSKRKSWQLEGKKKEMKILRKSEGNLMVK